MWARDEAQQLADVADTLSQQFPHIPFELIQQEVRVSTETFTDARIRTFVPVLVKRRVQARLRLHPMPGPAGGQVPTAQEY